jgi:hypothetical protein
MSEANLLIHNRLHFAIAMRATSAVAAFLHSRPDGRIHHGNRDILCRDRWRSFWRPGKARG